MQIGIEIEHWLVESDGRLASAGELPASFEWVEREFVDPLVEVKTPPCDSVEELTTVLCDRLDRVTRTARERGRRLVPLGTPLGDETVAAGSGTRTDVQRALLGDDLAHAAHCAGTHVHFEQSAVADQIRVLTALDPAFALVNTTPYYRGRRVAACARPHAYRRLCYGSLPDHGRLWRYPRSADEWRERRDARFRAFVDAAREAGVDPATVESTFTPHDAVWSPVRLRDDLGTVEWRAPDAGPLADVLRLVADVERVVATAVDHGTRVTDSPGVDDAVRVPPFEDLRERVSAAVDRGLSAPVVERHLAALGLAPEAYRPVGWRIDGNDRIDADAVRRLRRRHADRLERDLWRLRERDRSDDETAPASVPTR